MNTVRILVFSILIAILATFPTACDVPNQDVSNQGEVTESSSTALEVFNDFTDYSGTITVRVKTCDWSAAAQHPSAQCPMDPDFVLVGGGAEVEGEAFPGAMLTGSYPDLDLTTWNASSKDHRAIYQHRIRAYAIGLKLMGLSSTRLRSYIRLTTQTSGIAPHPRTEAVMPCGYQLIGGGAQAHFSGVGQLLTASYPDTLRLTWVAASKDHQRSDPDTVTAFAIGITPDIPGFGSLDIAYGTITNPSPAIYGKVSLPSPVGWALTGIGGTTTFSRSGRMLTVLSPFSELSQPGALVGSKSHLSFDAGTTSAFTVSIRKR